MSIESDLANRPTKEDPQATLFDLPPDWRDDWWGMPEFSMKDARPQYKMVVNFMTADDVKEFAKKLDLPVTIRSDSCWYPHQERLNGQIVYDGPKTPSRYPVCIPSKGRADCQLTGHVLNRMGVPHKFFVESNETEEYARHVGANNVVAMPFNDLGQGSIPARNC